MKLVLDTNVVLDWLVFRDAGVAGLQPALDRGCIQIITHDPALDELRRVLAYAQLKLAVDQQQQVAARYSSQTCLAALPAGLHLGNLGLPAGFPECRDRDDQHFLALAYHHRADGLVSKDKQVLKLAKRVQQFGVSVLDPQQLMARLERCLL